VCVCVCVCSRASVCVLYEAMWYATDPEEPVVDILLAMPYVSLAYVCTF
jgi:hypothetical protein